MTPAVAAPTFEHHRGGARHRRPRRPGCPGRRRRRPGGRQAAYELESLRGERLWGSATPVASDESVLVPWPDRHSAPASAPRCACASRAPDGDAVGVERAGRRRGRPARRRPTGSPLAGRRGDWTRTPSPTSAAPRPAAPRVRGARRPRRGPPLRHRARRSTRSRSTARGSATTRCRPGWTVLPRRGCATTPTTSPTCCAAGEQRHRRVARRRLVPRPARLATAASATCSARDLSLLAQLEITLRRRTHARPSPPTTRGAPRPGPIVRTRQLRRRALRRPPGARPGWSAPGYDDAGWRRVAVRRPRPARPSSRRRARRCAAPRRSRRSRC